MEVPSIRPFHAARVARTRAVGSTRPAALRSKVTNGKAMFVMGKGTSPWARRWRDLVELHANDLGGSDTLSQAQLSLCRRAATIEIELEAAEGRLSMGEPIDLDLFTRATGHLRRLLETLGIERRPRDVTPSLQEYLQTLSEQPEDADEPEDFDQAEQAEQAEQPLDAAVVESVERPT
jgi:hypothetical protein